MSYATHTLCRTNQIYNRKLLHHVLNRKADGVLLQDSNSIQLQCCSVKPDRVSQVCALYSAQCGFDSLDRILLSSTVHEPDNAHKCPSHLGIPSHLLYSLAGRCRHELPAHCDMTQTCCSCASHGACIHPHLDRAESSSKRNLKNRRCQPVSASLGLKGTSAVSFKLCKIESFFSITGHGLVVDATKIGEAYTHRNWRTRKANGLHLVFQTKCVPLTALISWVCNEKEVLNYVGNIVQ